MLRIVSGATAKGTSVIFAAFPETIATVAVYTSPSSSCCPTLIIPSLPPMTNLPPLAEYEIVPLPPVPMTVANTAPGSVNSAMVITYGSRELMRGSEDVTKTLSVYIPVSMNKVTVVVTVVGACGSLSPLVTSTVTVYFMLGGSARST